MTDANQTPGDGATERLRAKHTELHRRAQAAETALADLLRCNEKLASGDAWCGGSLGRAFLAYANSQLREEVAKLRAAIKAAGFAVMETSGAWSIHDVSERGKAEEAKSLDVATENVELEVENAKLRAALKPFAGIVIRDDPAPTVDDAWMATWCIIDSFPTVGAVRRAAELLAGKGEG